MSETENFCCSISQDNLSHSKIWEKMYGYYSEVGPSAWQQDIVPYQITSNKLIAHLYISLIKAAICDQLSERSKEQPYYILELGAGHGKFSFYMCKLLEVFDLYNQFNIVYIASDLSIKNIEFWQNHPNFAKYIANNQIDFARFDLMTDRTIELINSKKTIKFNTLSNNLFVIANYIFDTLPHDLFRLKHNKLFAGKINLKDQQVPSLKNFKFKYNYQPVVTDYYTNKLLNQMLLEYQQDLPKGGTFLLPVGALQAIFNIQKFTTKETIFLVADKGNINLQDFMGNMEPECAQHGSISFMVNYHALVKFFKLNQGTSIINSNPYSDLKIGCFIANQVGDHNMLNFIGSQVLYDVHPLNMINLCYSDNHINPMISLEQVLAVLNYSKWDPDLFFDGSTDLLKFLEQSIKKQQFNVEQEADLQHGLTLVAEYYFKLSNTQDLPFIIANVYYVLAEYQKAIKFFELSIQDFGNSAESWYNIALCYQALNKTKLFNQAVKQCLTLFPKYNLAKKLLK